MQKYAFRPSGVCSRLIEFELDSDNTVHNLKFTGGCNGNLQGIGRLVEGMNKQDAICRLKGVNCNGKGTSCPDQLALALEATNK